MNKVKLGKIIYISSLLIALGLFVYIFISRSNDASLEVIRTNVLISFLVFALVIPFGILAREYLLLNYSKKYFLIKIILNVFILLLGVLLWCFIQTANAYSFIRFIGIASLIIALVPSTNYEKKKV